MDKNYGWIPHQESWIEYESTVKGFADAAYAMLDGIPGPDEDPTDIFLYRAEAHLLRNSHWIKEGRLRSYNQGGEGSCVGHGAALAIGTTVANEIVNKREKDIWPWCDSGGHTWPARVSADGMYGLSRINSPLRTWQQGSFGSYAARAAKEYGVLWQLPYGAINLSYAPGWDAQKQSSLSATLRIKPAITHKLLTEAGRAKCAYAVKVRSTDDAWKFIKLGWGISIASLYGFESRRDSNGFSKASGSWAHQMAVSSRRSTAKRGFLVQNSWGDTWNSGSVYPNDQPWGSFWITEQVLASMLQHKDTECYAFGSYNGLDRSPVSIDHGFLKAA